MTKKDKRMLIAKLTTALNERGDYKRLLAAMKPLEEFVNKHRYHGQKRINNESYEESDIQGEIIPTEGGDGSVEVQDQPHGQVQ